MLVIVITLVFVMNITLVPVDLASHLTRREFR
jgi:hypothetical protein